MNPCRRTPVYSNSRQAGGKINVSRLVALQKGLDDLCDEQLHFLRARGLCWTKVLPLNKCGPAGCGV